MIELVFTLDYEIYGDGTGSLNDLVFEPAERLKRLFQKWNARFVTFVEAAEFRKIETSGTDSAISSVRRQIKGLHQDGFEIALHLHPQWFNAVYKEGHWLLDSSEYNLCKLSRNRITEIVDSSLKYLRQVLDEPDFTPLAFRAGNWLFQPTQIAAEVLYQRGVRVDSSVFKGGVQRSHAMDYRPSLKNGYYWRFQSDVNQPDRSGSWIEFPIYTRMVPFWEMVTSKRLKLRGSAGATQPVFANRISRHLDLLRFLYPLKLDFCRMTLSELTSTMEEIIREDRQDPETFRPVVAIGHTKDLTDVGTVEAFLSFLRTKQTSISTFAEVHATLTENMSAGTPTKSQLTSGCRVE